MNITQLISFKEFFKRLVKIASFLITLRTLLTLRTLNLHSNNYARKFMPIYTLNLSSRTFYNILKKKREKSYNMQKFTPNYSKHNFDVTSTNFDPLKLRNGEICPEYSRKKYVCRKLCLHNATLRINPTNKTSENNASV